MKKNQIFIFVLIGVLFIFPNFVEAVTDCSIYKCGGVACCKDAIETFGNCQKQCSIFELPTVSCSNFYSYCGCEVSPICLSPAPAPTPAPTPTPAPPPTPVPSPGTAACVPACPPGEFCIPNPLRACTFQELIYNIIDFLFALAIPLATLMIIVSAFYFVTAAGNPEQITTAKNIILWTLIGFLVILMAKGLVWFLMEVVFQAERPK